MFNTFRKNQFKLYNSARTYFIKHHFQLIELENYLSNYLFKLLNSYLDEFKDDYNEASYLFPFWQEYPPDDRGRQPKGDQYPWIEVGEHVFGAKIARYLAKSFQVRDAGLPTGPDQRFIIKDEAISDITDGLTDSCWLFIDIKSVGPRDDQDHIVMSHNQFSGSGQWNKVGDGVSNNIMKAIGKRASHNFHCAIPPIYILSDSTIAPVVTTAIKPVYNMLNLGSSNTLGQPLSKIVLISIPNGLLLEENPKYLNAYPGLLFPGKDDKGKNPFKMRCRISFPILQKIDAWRVKKIQLIP